MKFWALTRVAEELAPRPRPFGDPALFLVEGNQESNKTERKKY
jgi:hypothetical protein